DLSSQLRFLVRREWAKRRRIRADDVQLWIARPKPLAEQRRHAVSATVEEVPVAVHSGLRATRVHEIGPVHSIHASLSIPPSEPHEAHAVRSDQPLAVVNAPE